MTSTTKTQVIIVGAGPTGLSLATQLLRHGIDFIIIEKNEKTTQLSKAVVIQARTLEIFDELGIIQKALKTGQVTTAFNLFYKGKQKAYINLGNLGKGISHYPYALSLEQSKTEKLLVDHLAENQKTIQWNTEFGHFEQDPEKVTVYCKDSAGAERKIVGAYLVGCDGAGSLVRHQMGLSFKGDTVPKIFYVADVKLKSSVVNKNELFIFLIRKGFILFFPMEGEGHYRIIGILPGDYDEDKHFEFDDVKNFIREQVMVPFDFEELTWFSSYKVHSRKADVFENKRCFIAGDAAHIHTPAGGQGMNTGIQDAYNLAWKLAYTMRDEVKTEVLRTYNTERSQNAKTLLRTTDRMFDIMAGTNAFLDFVRLNIFPTVLSIVSKSPLAKKKVFPLVSQTAITYRDSYLTIDSAIGRVKAGVRMPYFVFSNGKQIFDYLNEPVFKILFFGNKASDSFKPFDDLKIKHSVLVFKEIPGSVFGKASDFYILLRPDNHISYIGKDLLACKTFFKKIAP